MTTATTHTHQEFVFAGFRCVTGDRRQGLPTRAQVQVVAGLAAGLTQKEIARARGCSPATVKHTVSAVMFRLHVARAAAVVAQALRRGWIAPLLVVLTVGAMNPNGDALRVRQPLRSRQSVSASARLMRRDVGAELWRAA